MKKKCFLKYLTFWLLGIELFSVHTAYALKNDEVKEVTLKEENLDSDSNAHENLNLKFSEEIKPCETKPCGTSLLDTLQEKKTTSPKHQKHRNTNEKKS